MTKKTDKIDEVIEPIETIEIEEVVPVEEKEEITVEKPVNNKPSKLYTIKVNQYTRVFIGEWFTFEPNKVYRVEGHIKAKLNSAGLLAPI